MFLENALGAGKIVLWLRTVVALAENWGLVPSIHMVANNCNSSFQGSDAFFWPLRVLHAHSTQTFKQAKYPYT